MTVPRIMPERWFYGSTGNRLIMGLVNNYGLYHRPLADGERYLGQFIVPAFQRPLVWTLKQKQRLIESIYIGMPIGSLVWNTCQFPKDDRTTDGWLLDGQQRMSAIIEFVQDEFTVCGNFWSKLLNIEQSHFLRIGIPIIQTNVADPEQCREIYDRLVYGGTPHVRRAA